MESTGGLPAALFFCSGIGYPFIVFGHATSARPGYSCRSARKFIISLKLAAIAVLPELSFFRSLAIAIFSREA